MLVKICGLSSEATLDAALDAGADRVGFVFFDRSPRHVSTARAAELGSRIEGRSALVALSVDADDTRLAEIVRVVRPAMLQLHGSEPPDRVAAVKRRFGAAARRGGGGGFGGVGPLPVVKALGLSGPGDLAAVSAYAAVADEILFDAKPPRDSALPGGNGRSFDWSILTALDLPVRFMLSGGLDPANVGDAIAITGADAVDVSSGVESALGIKDPDKIRAFVREARRAATRSD